MYRQQKLTNKKELRKPVSSDFDPKRLAINFEPPTIIIEYLVKDTGKLYHHKMRLDSVLRKNNVTRKDILNYVKTKHCLYFLNDKIKDSQILKFIDRILAKNLKGKPQLQKISETTNSNSNSNPTNVFGQGDGRKIEDDDFDYLNDDDEYDEDYEDYEEPEPLPKKQTKVAIHIPQSKDKEKDRNTFMTYCREYEDEGAKDEGAQWDLDMDDNTDFV